MARDTAKPTMAGRNLWIRMSTLNMILLSSFLFFTKEFAAGVAPDAASVAEAQLDFQTPTTSMTQKARIRGAQKNSLALLFATFTAGAAAIFLIWRCYQAHFKLRGVEARRLASDSPDDSCGLDDLGEDFAKKVNLSEEKEAAFGTIGIGGIGGTTTAALLYGALLAAMAATGNATYTNTWRYTKDRWAKRGVKISRDLESGITVLRGTQPEEGNWTLSFNMFNFPRLYEILRRGGSGHAEASITGHLLEELMFEEIRNGTLAGQFLHLAKAIMTDNYEYHKDLLEGLTNVMKEHYNAIKSLHPRTIPEFKLNVGELLENITRPDQAHHQTVEAIRLGHHLKNTFATLQEQILALNTTFQEQILALNTTLHQQFKRTIKNVNNTLTSRLELHDELIKNFTLMKEQFKHNATALRKAFADASAFAAHELQRNATAAQKTRHRRAVDAEDSSSSPDPVFTTSTIIMAAGLAAAFIGLVWQRRNNNKLAIEHKNDHDSLMARVERLEAELNLKRVAELEEEVNESSVNMEEIKSRKERQQNRLKNHIDLKKMTDSMVR